MSAELPLSTDEDVLAQRVALQALRDERAQAVQAFAYVGRSRVRVHRDASSVPSHRNRARRCAAVSTSSLRRAPRHDDRERPRRARSLDDLYVAKPLQAPRGHAKRRHHGGEADAARLLSPPVIEQPPPATLARSFAATAGARCSAAASPKTRSLCHWRRTVDHFTLYD